MMDKTRAQQWRDILERAWKTFFQAFLGSITIDSFFGVTNAGALKRVLLAVLVGAVSAGVSAVWNMLIQWLTIRIEELGDDEESTEEMIENEIRDLMEAGNDTEGEEHGEDE